MIKIVIYLFESSVLLTIFYLLYSIMMKKETFFNLNRFYLIAIVVFSLLLPFMSFDFNKGKIPIVDNSIEEINDFRMYYYETIEEEYEAFINSATIEDSITTTTTTTTNNNTEKEPINWMDILMKLLVGIYVIGVLICLSKVFWTFWRLIRMISIYPKEKIDSIMVIKVPKPIASFSFLGHAFIYEKKIGTPEMSQIIAHEKVHIKQRHSLDLIFVQFIASFLWLNPLIWRLIKSLKTTHEYIVDKKIINTGYSLVDYQTLLLNELVSNNSYGLVHNFNLSFIKKRITMMTNNKSGFSGKVKIALTIVCVVLLSLVIFQVNSKIADDRLAESKVQSTNDERERILTRMERLAKNNKSREEILAGITDSIERKKFIKITGPRKTFKISGDELSLEGKSIKIEEIESVVEEEAIGRHFAFMMEIDRNQSMKKISEIQTELRRLDRRKVLYRGETASGKQMIQPFIVPPFHWADPSRDDSIPPKDDLSNATIEGNIATLDGIEYLMLNLSKEGINYREEVYRFVKKHVDKKSTAYFIRAEYDDADTFENYLTNLAEVFQGFEKLFQVRAKELFNKNHNDLESSEYVAIGREAPKAVYIAGK